MMNISFPKECENLTKSQKKFFKSLGVAQDIPCGSCAERIWDVQSRGL